MAALHRTCLCDGCTARAVTFKHFPTVTGYCLEHGNVLANWLSLIDCPEHVIIGFDAARLRWERRRELRGTCGPS